MKLWLLNILACPICKKHPLNLTILEWNDKIKLSKEHNPRDFFIRDVRKDIISIDALVSIEDLTEDDEMRQRINQLKEYFKDLDSKTLKENVEQMINNDMKINDILEAIYTFDVKTGILKCSGCKRWYPIGSSIEGVPEMLPDNLRDVKKDEEFAVKWNNKVPREVFNS